MGEGMYSSFYHKEDYRSNPPSSCANSSYQGSPMSMHTSNNTDFASGFSSLSPGLASAFLTPMTYGSANEDYHEGERELHLALQNRFPFLNDQRKRSRKLLTTEQTKVLESILEKTVYPSTPLREAIAHQLGIPPRKVQIWFQNKRQGRRKLPEVQSPVETCCNSIAKNSAQGLRALSSADYQKLFIEFHQTEMARSLAPYTPKANDLNSNLSSFHTNANSNHHQFPPFSAHPSVGNGNVGGIKDHQMVRSRTQSELGSLQQSREQMAAVLAARMKEGMMHRHHHIHNRIKESPSGSGLTRPNGQVSSNAAPSMDFSPLKHMHTTTSIRANRPLAPPFWPKPRSEIMMNRQSASSVRSRPSPLSLDAHSLKNISNAVAINSSGDIEGRDGWALQSASSSNFSAITPTFPGDALGRQHIEAGVRLGIDKGSEAGLHLAPIDLTPNLNKRHGNLPRISELMRT